MVSPAVQQQSIDQSIKSCLPSWKSTQGQQARTQFNELTQAMSSFMPNKETTTKKQLPAAGAKNSYSSFRCTLAASYVPVAWAQRSQTRPADVDSQAIDLCICCDPCLVSLTSAYCLSDCKQSLHQNLTSCWTTPNEACTRRDFCLTEAVNKHQHLRAAGVHTAAEHALAHTRLSWYTHDWHEH